MLKFLRKTKYPLLLLLCVGVLAWIATLVSTSVKTLDRELPTERKPSTNQQHQTDPVERAAAAAASEELCPETSPLLRGKIKLHFESSLTFSQVAMENQALSYGQYEPKECKARQSVAVLIPHRNREKHLLYLLHYLHPFLQNQQLHYAIYVIHQAGERTFNRAKLLNIGYLEALKDYTWDCFIFHDVDLVPENDRNLYKCEDQPKHLVVGRNSTGYRLKYKGYFGGVSAMTKEQFAKVNGFPNTYWGWGGEDDDLRIRVELQGMSIVRPPADVARYTMVFHKRDNGNEANPNRVSMLQRTAQRWRTDGLNSCSYRTLSVQKPSLYINITVDVGAPTTTLN